VRILRGVDRSRMVIVAPNEAHVIRDLRDPFERAGIDSSRIEFIPRMRLVDYYRLFSRLEIALDTFPFHGHTTTCDCLWMGVPVITLAGRTAASRASVSVLRNIGFDELIAQTPQQYVEIGVRLARDLPRLAQMRRELRNRMAASAVCDAPSFVRDFEQAIVAAWQAAYQT